MSRKRKKPVKQEGQGDVKDAVEVPDLGKLYDKMIELAKKKGILDAVDEAEIQEVKNYFVSNTDPRCFNAITKPIIRSVTTEPDGAPFL